MTNNVHVDPRQSSKVSSAHRMQTGSVPRSGSLLPRKKPQTDAQDLRQAVFLIIGLVLWLRSVMQWGTFIESSSIGAYALLGLPTCLVMIPVVRRSPPIAALFTLFGQLLYSPFPFGQLLFLPSLPFISLFTVWIIFLLWRQRWVSQRTHPFDLRPFRDVVVLIALFLAIGISGAVLNGWIGYSETQQYVLDYIRTWLGVLVVFFLASRNMKDVRTLLLALPFFTLLYPLSIPLSAWDSFFESSISAYEILGVGLSYGTLNSNTLAEAMAIGGVVAVACWRAIGPSRLRTMLFLVFLASTSIGFFTGSRQFLVAWGVGIATIGFARNLRAGFTGLLLAAIIVCLGWWAVVTLLPDQSGLQLRWRELVAPTASWETQSTAVRLADFASVLRIWGSSSVLFGQGFVVRLSHNLVFGMLAETGLVGLTLFLTLWFMTIRRFLRSLRQLATPEDLVLVRGAVMGGLACVLVQQSVSGGDSGGYYANLLLGLMLGIIANANGLRKRNLAANRSRLPRKL